MITIHSDMHRLHAPKGEISGGEMVTPFESPFRAELILQAVRQGGLGPAGEPEPFPLDAVLAVHDPAYVDFLRTAWQRWSADGYAGDAIPTCFPARRMAQRPPDDIDGLLGYYAFAAETSIAEGTWQAALAATHCALTGAGLLDAGQRSAFALCRPPGHHAARDLFGGYCFLNHAAIAAQALRDAGAARVAVLDVDFHHGNGTQDIFYDRGDVLFASLHGDPKDAFPHFLGFADETGAGPGEGSTVNYPLPRGTPYERWAEALADAISRIRQFGAQALVVSLGVDTYEKDPISFFRLTSEDFTRYGETLGRLGLPTLFCMEGGYGVPELGLNTANVLRGFEGR